MRREAGLEPGITRRLWARMWGGVIALALTTAVLGGCDYGGLMTEESSSDGTIDVNAGKTTLWLTDCFGGDLLSVRVWTASMILWQLELPEGSSLSIVPGTYSIEYGHAPRGFIEETPAQSMDDLREFVHVTWEFQDGQRRELPPTFGVQPPFESHERRELVDMAPRLCGQATNDEGFAFGSMPGL